MLGLRLYSGQFTFSAFETHLYRELSRSANIISILVTLRLSSGIVVLTLTLRSLFVVDWLLSQNSGQRAGPGGHGDRGAAGPRAAPQHRPAQQAAEQARAPKDRQQEGPRQDLQPRPLPMLTALVYNIVLFLLKVQHGSSASSQTEGAWWLRQNHFKM